MRIATILLFLLLAGCVTSKNADIRPAPYRYIDKELGVACYSWHHRWDTIACVKITPRRTIRDAARGNR